MTQGGMRWVCALCSGPWFPLPTHWYETLFSCCPSRENIPYVVGAGLPILSPIRKSPPTPSCVWPGGGRGEGEVHPHATEINFLPINFRCRKIYHHLLSPFCGVDIESKNLPPCRGVWGVPGLLPGASPSAPLSSPQILCLGVTSLDQASVSSPELIISHPYSQAHKEAIMMSSCWFEK